MYFGKRRGHTSTRLDKEAVAGTSILVMFLFAGPYKGNRSFVKSWVKKWEGIENEP